MARLAPETIVAPPAATPPMHSLVVTAPNITEKDDRWQLGFQFMPENCVDASAWDPACPAGTLAVPTPPTTATSTTGGTLVPATYGYRLAATNTNGETTVGAEVTQVVPAGTNTNKVTLTWAATAGATGYNLYGRTAGGPWGLLVALPNVLTYVDTGAAVPGRAAGAANTASSRPAKSAAPVNRPVVYYHPFVIESAFECSVAGFEVTDYEGRARRQLEAATPKALEREFWTGVLRPDNFNLVNSTPNRPADEFGGILNAGGAGYMSRPATLSATTANAGGTLVPGRYAYRVTALNANGESLPSVEVVIVVPAGTNTNVVTLTWTAPPEGGATGYRVYGRTAAAVLTPANPQGVAANEQFINAPGNVLTYTDTGAITPNGALPASNSTPGAWTAVNPSEALSLLTAAMGSCGAGSRGMIHAPGILAEIWAQSFAISPEGKVLTTRTNGNLVVAGGGYPGTGPAGVGSAQAVPPAGQQWAYASDLVQVRLGPIDIIPAEFKEAIDRTTNTVNSRAERYAAASAAGCCAFAVLSTTLATGSS